MRTFLRQRGPAIQVAVGVLVAALAAQDLVGRPARPVDILGLAAGMFGAGLGLGLLLGRRPPRGRRRPGSD